MNAETRCAAVLTIETIKLVFKVTPSLILEHLAVKNFPSPST